MTCQDSCPLGKTNGQAPVVQNLMLDNAIHQINSYPVDKYKGNQLRYPLGREIYPVDSIIHLLNNLAKDVLRAQGI